MGPDRIILDVETTGFSTRKDRIWEIAALRVNNGSIKGVFHHVINPEIFIPAQITELCGITNEDVFGEPSFREIRNDLISFIRDTPIIAHNSPFDKRFLVAAYPNFRNKVFLDFLKYMRKTVPGLDSYSLENLCKVYKIPIKPHRALDDTKALFELIKLFGYPYE